MMGYLRLAGLAMAIAICVGAYFQGRSDGAAHCDARWLQRDAARVAKESEAIEKRDARVNAALEDERARTAVRLAAMEVLEKQVEDYEAQLAENAGCVLSDDDARSLSNIR